MATWTKIERLTATFTYPEDIHCCFAFDWFSSCLRDN